MEAYYAARAKMGKRGLKPGGKPKGSGGGKGQSVSHQGVQEVTCVDDQCHVPIHNVFMMSSESRHGTWEIVQSIAPDEWQIPDMTINRGVQTDETYIMDMQAGKSAQRMVTVVPNSMSGASEKTQVAIPDDLADVCLLQYTVAQLKTWLRDH
eukprot:447530-Amphidinium_carterae.1